MVRRTFCPVIYLFPPLTPFHRIVLTALTILVASWPRYSRIFCFGPSRSSFFSVAISPAMSTSRNDGLPFLFFPSIQRNGQVKETLFSAPFCPHWAHHIFVEPVSPNVVGDSSPSRLFPSSGVEELIFSPLLGTRPDWKSSRFLVIFFEPPLSLSYSSFLIAFPSFHSLEHPPRFLLSPILDFVD